MNKNTVSGIVLLLLLTSMLSSPFFIQQVGASGTAIMSPQNMTYTVNTGIPLTFTVYEFTSWMGYSLDGQLNATITGNTTLPTLLDGWHYLVVYANDTFGNMEASPARHFTVDTTAPTGSITINDGAASTISLQVKLTLLAKDATSGVAQMRFFEPAWADWEEYATSKFWEFKAGGGYMTVYVQFRDNAGLVSAPYPATIYLGDTPPPSGPPVARAPPAETSEETPEKLPEKTLETIVPKETVPTPEPTTPEPTTPEPTTPEPTTPIEPEPTEPEPLITTEIAIIAAVAIAAIIGVVAFWALKKRK